MANTLQLKRRIRSAQNVSKTTRAMQMIAASKLKRAQIAATSSRPYAEKLAELARTLNENIDESEKHPYMQKGKGDKTLIIVISPDKGFCGALNTNIARQLLHFKKGDLFISIGKKSEHAVVYLGHTLAASFPFGNTLPLFNMVSPVIKLIDEYYLSGKVSQVKILSTKFTSVFVQHPVVTPLLPLELSEEEKNDSSQVMLFEPNAETILPLLLTHYIETVIYQNLLESHVSEQAAKMIAMQNATDNAKSIVEDLTLEYNKVRQTCITSEILDISSSSDFTYVK